MVGGPGKSRVLSDPLAGRNVLERDPVIKYVSLCLTWYFLNLFDSRKKKKVVISNLQTTFYHL